jgi:hypothetical protein
MREALLWWENLKIIEKGKIIVSHNLNGVPLTVGIIEDLWIKVNNEDIESSWNGSTGLTTNIQMKRKDDPNGEWIDFKGSGLVPPYDQFNWKVFDYRVKQPHFPMKLPASIIVMSHLSDIQEGGDISRINFVKYVILKFKGDLSQEIDADKVYEEFKKSLVK